MSFTVQSAVAPTPDKGCNIMDDGVAARGASRKLQSGECPACMRETWLSFHHLIPKKVHRRDFFRKRYDRRQLSLGIYICRLCHDGIHSRFDEMTLAKELNEPSKLLAEPSLQAHFGWAARQKSICL
jgi:hypothetical protein